MCCRQNIFSLSHLRFSKLFTLFLLSFNLSFRTVRPVTNTLVFSFLINIAISITSLAISYIDSLFLTLLVPKCNMIESGELSSKHPLIWCFVPFVVAPGIDFTATEDFMLLLSLHPSIFFTFESPTISVFFRFVPPLFAKATMAKVNFWNVRKTGSLAEETFSLKWTFDKLMIFVSIFLVFYDLDKNCVLKMLRNLISVKRLLR